MSDKFRVREDIAFYAKVAAQRLGYVAGQVELTSKCEQNCRFCDSWIADRKGTWTGKWELVQVQALLGELAEEHPLFEHLAFTGGDPVSWPHLDDLLWWWLEKAQNSGQAFKLQLNTALPLPIPDPGLWRVAFDDVRVSFDAVDPALYRFMRGVHQDPRQILGRMVLLNHPRLTTNTAVSEKTIDHVPEIIEALARVANEVPFRKAMFLPILGFEHEELFWDKWHALYQREWPIPTSFATDQLPEFDPEVRCHAGSMSFHLKANGDLYPCCLIGGEALKTDPRFCIGNYFQTGSLEQLRRNYIPQKFYADPSLPCLKTCQFKQASVNIAAERASQTTLAMP